MTFNFHKATEISASVDGLRVRGAYSIILRNLIVYYNGRTASVPKPTDNLHEVAKALLAQLVRDTRWNVESVPAILPDAIRQAAAVCAEHFSDRRRILRLIQSFGPSIRGTEVHQQLSNLCVIALEPIVPAWTMTCGDPTAEQRASELRHWLKDRTHCVDWNAAKQVLVPYRDGQRIQDCDACALEAIAKSLAACAVYLETARVDSAVAALHQSWMAYSEGCWPRIEHRSFEQWFVQTALPQAWLAPKTGN